MVDLIVYSKGVSGNVKYVYRELQVNASESATVEFETRSL